MPNENESNQTAVVEKIDIMTAYQNLIAKAAEYGFTNEINDETNLPSHYLFNADKWETQRIMVETDYHKKSESTECFVVIDRISHNPYTADSEPVSRVFKFYAGTFDLTDLDFFEKLLLSIFPKLVNHYPF